MNKFQFFVYLLVALSITFEFINGNECLNKCGGYQSLMVSEMNGDVVCFIDPERNLNNVTSTCVLECEGSKPEDDQLKCFSKYCELIGTYAKQSYGFCEAPGTKTIGPKECEEKVGGGTAKYYGPACVFE